MNFQKVNRSQKSYTKCISAVYVPLDPKEPCGLLLLNRYYAKQDLSIPSWIVWLKIRDRWMREQVAKSSHGELICVYCERPCLPFTKERHLLATIDHIEPVSKSPHRWNDTTNFQVCCYKCNQEKADRDKPPTYYLNRVKSEIQKNYYEQPVDIQ